MRRDRVVIITALAVILLAGTASAEIRVVKARIGCLDVQIAGNLTGMVGKACNGKETCSFKAPTPKEYAAAKVKAATRMFCTQAMEITYTCSGVESHTVMVPGDAWNQPPAEMSCAASKPPAPAAGAKPDHINVRAARIGCLAMQTTPNLTAMVGKDCNGKPACSFKAPDEAKYKAAGVKAATRAFCTQAMEITYDCGRDDPRTEFVRGDAWKQPPADLTCTAVPDPKRMRAGVEPIKVTSARLGCLDVQKTGNLTKLVGDACNGRAFCAYPAPTPDAYKKAGVTAKTRALCSQAMEIRYRCGAGDDQVVTVDGDAWTHPPARLVCNGRRIATNRQDVTPPKETCTKPKAAAAATTEYFLTPKTMLDWTRTPKDEVTKIVKHFVSHDMGSTLSGFIPPPQPTPKQYPGGDVIATIVKSKKTNVIGANEGRVRAELRAIAAKHDAMSALCQAAQRFTRNQPASRDTPSDDDFGKAFADLSVTGKLGFASFVKAAPDETKLKAHAECAGASDLAIAKALDRAYAVANALRGDHMGKDRQDLGWVAVSGEDDQPYRPVNVPSTNVSLPKPRWFQQFDMTVTPDIPRARIPVKTRYTIAHENEPAFAAAPKPLVDGGKRKVLADPLPAIAPDAEVLIFIHGMDSRAEEAMLLTQALHSLPGKHNWTVISLDLPTSGYADNIDHNRISPIAKVGCHNTPVLDFIQEYIVAFVDQLDKETKGQLKPRIKAVIGGSLGGNMAMRLGRRENTTWLPAVVPWSPAAIWPSKVGQKDAVMAGCDTDWKLDDIAVNTALYWGGNDPFFAAQNELDAFRYMLFYGGFDYKPLFGITGEPPQAQCWMSDKWPCKQNVLVAARLDRHETYDRYFRAWHWRLGAEQLVFSQQQFRDGTKDPLYLYNDKPMLLLCGYDDTCGQLCEITREVAAKMVNTPGYARFMKQTGHSLDTEYPMYVAKEIEAFVGEFVK